METSRFPRHVEVKLTALRSDIVILSVNLRNVVVVKLTVPFKVNIDKTQQCKLEKI